MVEFRAEKNKARHSFWTKMFLNHKSSLGTLQVSLCQCQMIQNPSQDTFYFDSINNSFA